MKRWLFFVLIALFTLTAIMSAVQPENEAPKGDYMGQAPPGKEVELFAPGFISTGLNERDSTFSPDLKEFYYSILLDRFSAIAFTRCDEKGVLSKPEIAPFSGRYSDIEPCIAPDNKKFFFVSQRPLPGQDQPTPIHNLWVMNRTASGWGEPQPVGAPINGAESCFYPSITRDGTIYFCRPSPDRSSEAIYRSRFIAGQYQAPEKLPVNVNSTQNQFNAFIAPDESFLIVPVFGRKDTVGATDYYVTFRNSNDTWTELINLGNRINTAGNEYCPYITPDGKYFMFHRVSGPFPGGMPEKPMTYADIVQRSRSPQNGQGDIYWTSAEAIRSLKPRTPVK